MKRLRCSVRAGVGGKHDFVERVSGVVRGLLDHCLRRDRVDPDSNRLLRGTYRTGHRTVYIVPFVLGTFALSQPLFVGAGVPLTYQDSVGSLTYQPFVPSVPAIPGAT